MDNPKKLKIAIVAVSMALLTSLGFLARALWLNHCWRGAIDEIASQAGVASASLDFRKGNMVLWKIEGTNINVSFLGHDGPFQVWLADYRPDSPEPMEYGRRKVAEIHNERLRYMYEHPDKFKANFKLEPRAKKGEVREEDK